MLSLPRPVCSFTNPYFYTAHQATNQITCWVSSNVKLLQQLDRLVSKQPATCLEGLAMWRTVSTAQHGRA